MVVFGLLLQSRKLKLPVKIFRAIFGGYPADSTKLKKFGYANLKFPRPIITVRNTDQGFGQINGLTTQDESGGQTLIFPNAQICVFKKSTRQILWETVSKSDGTYHIRNIAVGLECFVVAFDPNREYNAVIEYYFQ